MLTQISVAITRAVQRFRLSSLFTGSQAGGWYDINPQHFTTANAPAYQTTAGLLAADDVGDNIGLDLAANRDGRGIKNRIPYSNQFAQWGNSTTGTGSTPVVTSGYTDPYGGLKAWRLLADRGASNTTGDESSIKQTVVGTLTNPHEIAIGIWAKSNTGANQTVYFRNTNGGAANNFTATTTWTFFPASAASIAATSDIIQIGARGTITDQTVDVLICFAQVKVQNVTLTAADYQENGPSLGGPGEHLFQDVSASRVTYGRWPRGGVRNRLSNNTGVGVSAGTPGTPPTGWSVTSTGGVVTRTVGTPYTEDGIVYTPIRYQFSGSGNATVQFSQNTTLAGAQGQDWANSVYVKLGAGSYTNVTTIVGINELSSVPAYLAGGSSGFVATSTAQRVSHLRTLTNASTVYVTPIIFFSATGAADITIDVGSPQFEKDAAVSNLQLINAAYDITETGVPSIPSRWGDGASDYEKLGKTALSDGTTELFAEASESFVVMSRLQTFVASGTVGFASAGATEANRNWHFYLNSSGQLVVVIRGTATTLTAAGNLADGNPRIITGRWDGSAANVWINATKYSVSVGSASKETQKITFRARTESSPGQIGTGFQDPLIIRAGVMSDSEVNQAINYTMAEAGAAA